MPSLWNTRPGEVLVVAVRFMFTADISRRHGTCVAQVVIAVAESKMRSPHPGFPVGRTRLETVGVVACAVIMTLSTIEVIQSSSYDLYEGIFAGVRPSWPAPWPETPRDRWLLQLARLHSCALHANVHEAAFACCSP